MKRLVRRIKKRNDHQPKLCPTCPLRYLWDIARKNLLVRQWLKEKEEPGNLDICIEVRRIAQERGIPRGCPYFSQQRSIGSYG